jgi:Mitochondrial carrier protein
MRYLIAGGAGGSVGCAVAYPLDLIKTKLTSDLSKTSPRYAGLIDCTRQILQREGVRGLYKGLGATLLQVTPTLAVNFTAYEMSKAFMMGLLNLQPPAPPPARERALAHARAVEGAAAGAAPARQGARQGERQDPGGMPPLTPNMGEDAMSMDRQWQPPASSSSGAAPAASSRQTAVGEKGGAWTRQCEGISGLSPTALHSHGLLHARQQAGAGLSQEHASALGEQGSTRGVAGEASGRQPAHAAPRPATHGQAPHTNGRVAPSNTSKQAESGNIAFAGGPAAAGRVASRKEAFQEKRIGSKAAVSLVAGSASGVVSSTLTFPLDVIRRNLQATDGMPESYMQARRRQPGLYASIAAVRCPCELHLFLAIVQCRASS